MSSNPNQPPRPAANHLSRKLLALDHGERRVGVAVSDELGMLAHPRSAITHTSTAAVLDAVAELVRDEEIAEVIVGLPLSLSGEAGHQAREARSFTASLRAALSVPVIEVDERLSSQAAANALAGRERKRSGQRDSVAAALVLQAVLDSRRQGAAT